MGGKKEGFNTKAAAQKLDDVIIEILNDDDPAQNFVGTRRRIVRKFRDEIGFYQAVVWMGLPGRKLQRINMIDTMLVRTVKEVAKIG